MNSTSKFFLPSASLFQFYARLTVYKVLIFSLIILGVLFRVIPYLTFRSLSLDEAALARNIVERGMVDLLFEPLDYAQGAPLLYLFLSKMLVLIFGKHEGALQLISLLAGVGGIILIYLVALNWIGNTGAVVAVTFFIFSQPLIGYAAVVKQYSSDAFVTLLLLAIYLPVLHG